MFRSISAVAVATAIASPAVAGDGNYSNDFNTDSGNFRGAASRIDSFGTMQLVGDYVPGGNYFGTWTTGALDRPDADGPISSFNASFKFAFNNNSNGSGSADGFSFLFGSMNDLDGSMQTVMRAVLNRIDSLEEKMGDVVEKLNQGDQEDLTPPAWGGA